MNRYQFEDLISSYIDNEITLSKRKEFEKYMKESKNPSYERNWNNGTNESIKKRDWSPWGGYWGFSKLMEEETIYLLWVTE